MFAETWARMTTDQWVLRTIREGYKLEFTEVPQGLNVFHLTPIPADEEQARLLLQELRDLITKRAVFEVEHLPPGFFMSTFFLAPKKGGKWRPILNLRPLNRFIRPTRFRMETLHSILPLLRQGWWATSVDLKDAYLHIPILPEDRRFLSFRLQGRTFCFRTLPFGLSTAPRVFTRVARVFGAYLRRLGIQIFLYLDDWLIVAETREAAARDTTRVVQEARNFGWIINLEKSDLQPSQTPTFLGAVLDFVQARARPTQERILAVQEGARVLLGSPLSSARAWLVFLGYLASLVDLVPWCRYHMRDLQFHLLRYFDPASGDLRLMVPLSSEVIPAIQWWLSETHLTVGVIFRPPKESAILITDASLSGWGATLGAHQVAGFWSGEWLHRHINVLELEAVHRAVLHFAPQLLNRCVLLKTDNTTVVAYLNRQGGTRSRQMWSLTKVLLSWCMNHGVLIKAIHLPGKENTIADSLSRLTDSPTEWSLPTEVTDAIWARFGQPEVDLFASPWNNKLPTFCALTPHARVWQVDAFACDWRDLVAYAFPPMALVSRVLEKVQADECRYVLLVAPLWPGQPWFPTLTRLLCDGPRLLPARQDLLTIPDSGRRHHNPALLHLTVWPLSANPLLRRAFQKRLRTSPPTSADNPPWICIRGDSEFSTSGASAVQYVQPKPL